MASRTINIFRLLLGLQIAAGCYFQIKIDKKIPTNIKCPLFILFRSNRGITNLPITCCARHCLLLWDRIGTACKCCVCVTRLRGHTAQSQDRHQAHNFLNRIGAGLCKVSVESLIKYLSNQVYDCIVSYHVFQILDEKIK